MESSARRLCFVHGLFFLALISGSGSLAAQTVISFDGDEGQARFNAAFKQPNTDLDAATWNNAKGGLNAAGQVSVSGPEGGEVIYDTSLTAAGVDSNPGTGGRDANKYQDGEFALAFSLANYASNNQSQVGLLFRIDSDSAGLGNGYIIIVNTVLFGGNNVFEYRLFKTVNYAPSGSALGTSISSVAVPATPSPYYTLSVRVSGSTFTAQLSDSSGTALGSAATFTDSTYAMAGATGFRVEGGGIGEGASVYQFRIASGKTVLALPTVIPGQHCGGSGTPAGPYGSITAGVAAAITPGTIVQMAAEPIVVYALREQN